MTSSSPHCNRESGLATLCGGSNSGTLSSERLDAVPESADGAVDVLRFTKTKIAPRAVLKTMNPLWASEVTEGEHILQDALPLVDKLSCRCGSSRGRSREGRMRRRGEGFLFQSELENGMASTTRVIHCKAMSGTKGDSSLDETIDVLWMVDREDRETLHIHSFLHTLPYRQRRHGRRETFLFLPSSSSGGRQQQVGDVLEIDFIKGKVEASHSTLLLTRIQILKDLIQSLLQHPCLCLKRIIPLAQCPKHRVSLSSSSLAIAEDRWVITIQETLNNILTGILVDCWLTRRRREEMRISKVTRTVWIFDQFESLTIRFDVDTQFGPCSSSSR
jgi:hypothetical protein